MGADGATHAGSFDLAYLCCLPDFVVMAPADELELRHMVATAAAIDNGPARFVIRAARDLATKCRLMAACPLFGKGRIIREGSTVAILSLGTRLSESRQGRRQTPRYGVIDDGCGRSLRQTP